MSDFRSFMAGNALPSERVKFVASKRFIDQEGEPIEWEIESITENENESLRKECTKKKPMPGKRGQSIPETDFPLYLGKLAVRCTVFPDLNNAELQDSYGVMGADNLLKKMLISGEYSDYMAKVQEVNKFDISFEDMAEEAKN